MRRPRAASSAPPGSRRAAPASLDARLALTWTGATIAGAALGLLTVWNKGFLVEFRDSLRLISFSSGFFSFGEAFNTGPAGFLIGSVLGLGQWIVLRRRVPRAWAWLPASAFGGVGLVWGGPFLGALSGLLQWLFVLGPRHRGAWKPSLVWPAASTLGWTLASAPFAVAARNLRAGPAEVGHVVGSLSDSDGLSQLVAWSAASALSGLVTGAALAWLLAGDEPSRTQAVRSPAATGPEWWMWPAWSVLGVASGLGGAASTPWAGLALRLAGEYALLQRIRPALLWIPAGIVGPVLAAVIVEAVANALHVVDRGWGGLFWTSVAFGTLCGVPGWFVLRDFSPRAPAWIAVSGLVTVVSYVANHVLGLGSLPRGAVGAAIEGGAIWWIVRGVPRSPARPAAVVGRARRGRN